MFEDELIPTLFLTRQKQTFFLCLEDKQNNTWPENVFLLLVHHIFETIIIKRLLSALIRLIFNDQYKKVPT